MLPIQERGRHRGDEKLTAVGILAAVGHAEQARGVVAEGEVFVREGFGVVDGDGAGAVAVEEVAALDHEIFNLGTVSTNRECCD